MKKTFILSCIYTIILTISGSSTLSAKDKASSERWVIWSQQAAGKWEDAFVTGNGTHGMMVFGKPSGVERITCVHEELFIRGWNRHKNVVPTTAHLMPEVRKLMDEGRSDDADALMVGEADRQLRESGAQQRWPLIPHPAFDLCIDWGNNNEAEEYRRQLDLESGEGATFWKTDKGRIEERYFSSRTHGVNAISLRSRKGAKIDATVSLLETPGRKGEHFGHDLDNAFSFVETAAGNGWLTYRAGYDKDPGGYDGVAKVHLKGGKMTQQGASLKIENADEVLILLHIAPWERKGESNADSIKEMLSAIPCDYKKLLKAHAAEHGGMFRRMQFDLGCADEWKTTPVEKLLAETHKNGASPLFLEQVQAMGRYLLISSCGKYPPPLQGIWGGGWRPAWIGGFVWDSNLNLAISAAPMSNLGECAGTYAKYIESLLPGWRTNARNYLGCRGFIVAHYNDPGNGYMTHFTHGAPWMFWAGGAGWNIRPLYEYAMLSGDKEFLKNRVYPLYKEMALFYEDYLRMGSDGRMHISPGVSPENWPEGTHTWLSKDATMEVAVAREVYGLLEEMGRSCGAGGEELKRWKLYRNLLPDYRINNDGALAEWIDSAYRDVYDHRHNSHLYPLFPGWELAGGEADAKLQKAANVAMDKRFAFDTSSAHGLVHLALMATRLKRLDIVEFNIDRFSRRNYLYNSLATSHEPGNAIYNLDAILSFPRLMMEMLAFTKPGVLELMPAWPENYPDGTLKGMRIYGGHTMDISWKSGEPVSMTIHAAADENLTLKYKNARESISLRKGEKFNWKNKQ